MIQNARKRYTTEYLCNCSQGSTYVSFDDMIKIQLFSSGDKQEIEIIKDSGERREVRMKVKRSWQNMINLIKMEDQTCFGYAFRPIPQFSSNYHSSCLTWCLFAIFSSCKELWNIVDTKASPFRSSSWEGWLLTAVHHSCFQNNILNRIDNTSPLKKPKNMNEVIKQTNKLIPELLSNSNGLNGTSFFQFNFTCINNMFQHEDYNEKILVRRSHQGVTSDISSTVYKDVEVIIIVGEEAPSTYEIINNSNGIFELRVLCVLKCDRPESSRNKYDAIRYMRHGNGFNCFWKQERCDPICSHSNSSLLEDIALNADEHYFLQYIQMFVRKFGQSNVDRWKLKFFNVWEGRFMSNASVVVFLLFRLIFNERTRENVIFKNI